jgi:hypothetical protein
MSYKLRVEGVKCALAVGDDELDVGDDDDTSSEFAMRRGKAWATMSHRQNT